MPYNISSIFRRRQIPRQERERERGRETSGRITIARSHPFSIRPRHRAGKFLTTPAVRSSLRARGSSYGGSQQKKITVVKVREENGGGFRPRYGNMNFVRGINFRNKRCQVVNDKARETSRGGTIKPSQRYRATWTWPCDAFSRENEKIV